MSRRRDDSELRRHEFSASLRLASVSSVLALLVSVSSCNSSAEVPSDPSGSGSQAPAVVIAQRITSPDGVLTIEVPEGALPPGTNVSISVADDAPEGHLGPAYRIEPSGLIFAKPVQLSFKRAAGDATPVVGVARAVNGTWKLLRESFTTREVASGLTSHFSIYSLVAFGTQPLSSQISAYVSVCKLECRNVAACVPAGAPTGANGCDLPETGWGASLQKSALQCLERAISDINPKKVEVATGPCTPCLRECCSTRLTRSTFGDACQCTYDEDIDLNHIHDESAAHQNLAWMACATQCVGERLPPGPNEICGADLDVVYVTPSLADGTGNVIERGTIHRGSTILVRGLSDPTSVAVDEAGNVFFVEYDLKHDPPAILSKRSPAGAVSKVATVLSNASGVYLSWSPELAVSPTGTVAYTTPTQASGPNAMPGGGPTAPPESSPSGSIRTIDGATWVSGLKDDPTGLAFAPDGTLYFGTHDQNEGKWYLHKRAPSGAVTELGVVVDSSVGGVAEHWRFGLAVSSSGDVYYTTPRIETPGSGTLARNASIRKFGGPVLLESDTAEFRGLSVDADGALIYGEETAAPIRIRLKKRLPAGTVSDYGVVVDTGSGGVAGTWSFATAVP